MLTYGVSGSGKSTVTDKLVQQVSAVRIRSDVERKRLAGLLSGDRTNADVGAGIYTPEFTEKTYAHLMQLVRQITASGFIAIVDATFLKHAQRAQFIDLAAELNIPLVILNFQVAEDELRRRVEARYQTGIDPSEATLQVLEAQLSGMEALTGEELKISITIDENGELPVSEIEARLK